MSTGKTTKVAKSKTKSTKSLNSGMSSTEVCKIIKACKESNVSSFLWNGLELTLHEQGPDNYTAKHNFIQYPIEQKEELGDNEMDTFDLTEASEHAERDLEELKLSDPLAYEKVLQQGDYINA